MSFENISSLDEMLNFFNHRKFEIQNYENLIKIDKNHHIKFIIEDSIQNENISEYLKEFKKYKSDIQYILLVDKSFTKFLFLRDYGKPIKFSYDKEKKYAKETKSSILKKLNSLQYQDCNFNSSMNYLFDVKEIVNKFYDEFKRIKNILSKNIKNTSDNPLLYAQIILDRIIFIYFLQVKEVLPKNYLSDLYLNKKKSENYYDEYLKPLFFEMLNSEKRSNDLILKFGSIPYLNGGLFAPKNIEKNNNNLKIGDEIWGEIFSLLNGYEWILEEEKGDSTTITPGILGHIYEKSVIAATQKETGSYYTADQITNYICENTIYPNITDKLNQHFGKNYNFISLLENDEFDDSQLEVINYLYFKILKKIKICDNACGSGAFLIAAEHILFDLYYKCINILKDKPFFEKELANIKKCKNVKYFIKKNIITKNLYGVDLQEGAIEIAKLRLWLSMVSEMELRIEDIEPLPNIDYNLMSGNSLIGHIDLPKSWGATLFDDPDNLKSLLLKRQESINLYRETRSSTESVKIVEELSKINEKIRDELNSRIFNQFRSNNIKITKDELAELKPFHWGFEFYEIYGDNDNEEKGFDIIVGNPPYGNILTKYEKDFIKVAYKFKTSLTDSLRGSHNAASIFIERSYSLLKSKGNFSYIIPHRITRTQEFESLRHMILNNTFMYEIVDSENPFEGVTLEMVEIFFKKIPIKNNEVKCKSRRFSLNKEPELIGIVNSEIYRKYNMFLIYYDELFDKIASGAKFDFLKGSQGFPRRSDYSTNEKEDGILCIGAENIDPYTYTTTYKKNKRIVSKKYLKNNILVDQYKNYKLLTPNFSNSFEVCLKPPNYLPDGGAVVIEFRNINRTDIKYIMALLNSKLINYFLHRYLQNYGKLTNNICSFILEKVPIIISENQNIFIRLCDYMIFLKNIEDELNKEYNLINIVENRLINPLIYSLYLKKDINDYLLESLENNLVDINLIENKGEKLDAIKSSVIIILKDSKITEELYSIMSLEEVKTVESEYSIKGI